MRKEQLVFEIDKSKILNSNAMPTHFAIKGNIVSYLRSIAAEEGLSRHSENNYSQAEKRLQTINSQANWVLMKKRARSAMKKKNPDKLTDKQIDEIIEEKYANEKPEFTKDEIEVNFLFQRFNILITVCPPSKRRFDPPNLYPTVKAIVDGLTDASWWPDDDFNHQNIMSFKYGEPTGVSGLFKLIFDIEEVPSN